MRTISLNFRQALFSQESGEIAVFLLTITHPNLPDPIRLSSDATTRLSVDPLLYGSVSRGEQYLFVGMDIALPAEREKSPPATQMVVSNIDRSLVPLVRSIDSPAQILLEGVLVSDMDTIEFTIPALDIINVNFNATQLTFDLSMDALALEPYPSGSFDPASFPGLFP